MDKNEQIKACQWVDPKCHYFKSMTFENNKITVNRGSYVFGKPLNLSNKETEN